MVAILNDEGRSKPGAPKSVKMATFLRNNYSVKMETSKNNSRVKMLTAFFNGNWKIAENCIVIVLKCTIWPELVPLKKGIVGLAGE